MARKLLTINPDFPGYWTKRNPSYILSSVRRIDVFLTILIFGLVSFQVLLNLSLVSVTALIITAVGIIFLVINYEKYPLVTIPLSQIIVLFLVGYIHLLIINPQLISQLTPDPIDLVLGTLMTIRVFTGMYIIRMHFHYSRARIPVSKNIQDSLHLFETHLKLTETKMNQFREESFSTLITFFRNLLMIFLILGILLIPLWMNLIFNILIYPYIFLIPSILLSLLILIVYLQRAR